MPRYIIDNKIYDTDTSELLYIGKAREVGAIDLRLYKSKHGNYFGIQTYLFDIKKFTFDEEGFKKMLIKANVTDLYEKLFGKLEEA